MSDSPWLTIPLDDYEAHMALPSVGQAALLADALGEVAAREKPESVALLGCAGGNGLDRLDPAVTRRVVVVDVNASFVETASTRFASRFVTFEAHAGSIPGDPIAFAPVSLIFAALLFEYVPLEASMAWMLERLGQGGLLATVVQLPSEAMPFVTRSPFASLEVLAGSHELRSPEELRRAAEAHGAEQIETATRRASGGKEFRLQLFRLR